MLLPTSSCGELDRRSASPACRTFPTVGLIDGSFRANLEETGMGYGLEVEMIRTAHELDLLTTPYVFSDAEARAMTEAGADIVVCHMGLTTGGAIGAETALTLDDCVPPINAWAAAARAVNPDVIVLCHGGPIATPDDATYILKHCPDCHGFYGASSMERLPTEVALTEQTRKFKSDQTKLIEPSRPVAEAGTPREDKMSGETIGLHPRPDRLSRSSSRSSSGCCTGCTCARRRSARSCAPASAGRRW